MSTEFLVDTQYTSEIKQELLFAWIFILFIFSWISIDVVGRALNNFTFRTLKLDENSTWHTTIIALVVVVLELLTIYYLRSLGVPIYDSNINSNSNPSINTENTQKENTQNNINKEIDYNSIINNNYKPYIYQGINNVSDNIISCNLNFMGELSNVNFI